MEPKKEDENTETTYGTASKKNWNRLIMKTNGRENMPEFETDLDITQKQIWIVLLFTGTCRKYHVGYEREGKYFDRRFVLFTITG